ncbi:MAG: asparagine synthase (glutamine-hydrolyzing) [Acidobacteria bacterium SCN 69-37]|nr:MAG: asparagine synthase (glutamine-hydrolyzing) [Acidobacteria bacterium SCN 69-37]
MCGIAGIWQPDGPPVDPGTIRRFIRALAHRGPDGEDVVAGDADRLALAHRRLAILDPGDASAQPMWSASGRYAITYNGELYNFLELRTELARDGVRFRSDGDTEVMLAAFERWGPDGLLRCNGMWALAIWDARERRLWLARDRFGVKPLYVTRAGNRFAFASELKAFLHLDEFVPTANPTAVAARLADDVSGHVLLDGIEMLPPGHCLEVTPTGARRRRWWHTIEHLVDVPRERAAQAEAFRALVIDACRLRLRSDVPLATSLSGGLDSSSVICALAEAAAGRATSRRAPAWQRAFIAGFAGTSQDETADALLTAERAGATAVVRQFASADLRTDVDAFLYQFEEIGGLYGLAAWALYREIRRAGLTISIDGHGGDELLGGYDVHLLAGLLRGRGLLTEPRRTIDLIATWHGLHGARLRERVSNGPLLAALTIPGVLRAARTVPFVERRTRWLTTVARQHSFEATTAVDEGVRAEERAIDALGPMRGALYRSFHHLSLPRILRNFDVHAMGHGVEVRMPLLDWRVVCFAFSVPERRGGGYTKGLLRDAMSGMLPERVRRRRRKLGYNAPVADWLNGSLAGWLADLVHEPGFVQSDLWDGPALRALAERHRRHRSWVDADARRVVLAATAYWWQTRWLRPRG